MAGGGFGARGRRPRPAQAPSANGVRARVNLLLHDPAFRYDQGLYLIREKDSPVQKRRDGVHRIFTTTKEG
jgi:hypothetical protein